MIHVVRKRKSPLVVAIDEMRLHDGLRPLHGIRAQGPRLFCLHGKDFWTRTLLIGPIPSFVDFVIALEEISVDAWRFFDLCPSLNFASGTCFIIYSFAFPKFSIEWNSMHLREQRTAYSPGASPKTHAPDRRIRDGAHQRKTALMGSRSTRQLHAPSDAAMCLIPPGCTRSLSGRHPVTPDSSQVSPLQSAHRGCVLDT